MHTAKVHAKACVLKQHEVATHMPLLPETGAGNPRGRSASPELSPRCAPPTSLQTLVLGHPLPARVDVQAQQRDAMSAVRCLASLWA